MTRTETLASAVVDEVAERLRSPRSIAQAMACRNGEVSRPGRNDWSPGEYLGGHPGIASFYLTLAISDESWLPVAHDHLAAAVQHLNSGGCWIPYSRIALCGRQARIIGGDGYEGLIEKSERIFLENVREQVRKARVEATSPVVYDAIYGLAGSGRQLLGLIATSEPSDGGLAGKRELMQEIIGYLSGLADPVDTGAGPLPGWRTEPTSYAVGEDRDRYPDGDFNLGLSHGVAGPLALLSIARRYGFWTEEQEAAVRTFAGWLLGWRINDAAGVFWPGRVSQREELESYPSEHEPGPNASWCYGIAGIASALHLAGQALDDPPLRRQSVDAMRGVFARERSDWQVLGPTLCHGLAGVLHGAVRIASASGDGGLLAGAEPVARSLVDHFDRDSPYGFRHRDHERSYDAPGLLMGAAGAALALLGYADPGSLASADGLEVSWDSALLLR